MVLYDIIKPDPSTLQRALALDPRVKYVPAVPTSDFPSIGELEERGISLANIVDCAARQYVPMLFDPAIERIQREYPRQGLGIRGTAVYLGEERGMQLDYHKEIKTLREVLETGTERKTESGFTRVITSKGMPYGIAMQYAVSGTKSCREAVAPSQKSFFFPGLFVYDLDLVHFEEPWIIHIPSDAETRKRIILGVYILDFIDVKHDPVIDLFCQTNPIEPLR